MSKIVICALNGSGKTILGAKLEKLISYKHIDIENYYFNNNDITYKYSSALTKEEVTKMLEDDFDRYDNIIFYCMQRRLW